MKERIEMRDVRKGIEQGSKDQKAEQEENASQERASASSGSQVIGISVDDEQEVREAEAKKRRLNLISRAANGKANTAFDKYQIKKDAEILDKVIRALDQEEPLKVKGEEAEKVINMLIGDEVKQMSPHESEEGHENVAC